MTTTATDRTKTITLIALAYGLLRIAIELFGISSTASLWYLLALTAGLGGLLVWQASFQRVPAQTDTSTVRTLHLIALTILVIALLMDAGRLLLRLFS